MIDLEEKKDIESFQNEIRMQLQISSPHIVKLHGSIVENTKLWIIMEELVGSLKDFLTMSPFEEQYCAIILRETLYALEYIHKEGKIHSIINIIILR